MSEPIAIVGIGCRLPGGVNRPQQLVRFLEHNGDGVVTVPKDRWDIGRFYSANRNAPGRVYVKHAGFLSRDVFEFDPAPFALSPREAEVLDPQQRLLLEATWEGLEDAGIPVTDLRGTATGVYVGAFMLDSRDILTHPANRALVGPQASTGTSNTVLSNRISYTFDFRGPSLSVDTACSSSLVAIHLACRDLIDGSCDLAIAGGVNVMLSPASTLVMCKGQFLAPDGRSKSFDASADGYGRGEGVALVVAKRLRDAVRDGDRIYATILASGVNQDGRTEGMAMPNGDAQRQLARAVSEKSGVRPHLLGYVEAHGTGTRAGDPVEVAALAGVYGGPERSELLPIGSIKSNIGHLEAAAGAAGLVKAALSIYHGRIWPVRALDKPNPAIPFDEHRVRVPVQAEPWPQGLERTAAVNSFGYGGTNAHAVLGSVAPQIEPERSHDRERHVLLCAPRLIPVNAFDDAALRQRATDLDAVDTDTGALASTLAHHRAHAPIRATISVGTAAETSAALQDLAAGRPNERVQRGRVGDVDKLLWVYTGMGPQWWGMARGLLAQEPVYRRAARQVDEMFADLAGFSLLKEMGQPEAQSNVARNRIAQPANFLVQVGLTTLLRHHGVSADGYLGHSVGELTAAWAAGCLSLEDATTTAFHRSQLQDRIAGQGTMLAASISLEHAQALCRSHPGVDVAAMNAPTSVALSGTRSSLLAIEDALHADGHFARVLQVEVAYHSRQMDPLRHEFFERLDFLDPGAPHGTLYSTATGQALKQPTHDAAYWWRNARQPVLLQRALELALVDGFDGFLEIGPHPVLAAVIQENARAAGKSVQVLSTLHRKRSDASSWSATLGNLYTSGRTIDWEIHAPRLPRCALPSYPFQLKRHWNESEAASQYRLGRPGAAALLDGKDSSGRRWCTELDDARFGWLAGHNVLGSCVFPGAGSIDLALCVARETLGERSEYVVEDLQFQGALVLPAVGFAEVCASLEHESLVITGKTDAGWQDVAVGRISGRSIYLPLGKIASIGDMRARMRVVAPAALYEKLASVGLRYTGEFRALHEIWVGRGEALAQLRVPVADGAARHMVFPATLDATFQLLVACLPGALRRALVPVRIEVVRACEVGEGPLWCHVEVERTGRGVRARVRMFDARGRVCLLVQGLECEPVERHRGLKPTETTWLHGQQWVAATLCPPDSGRGTPIVAAGGGELATVVADSPASEVDRAARVHVVFSPGDLGDDPTACPILDELAQLTRRLCSRGQARLTVVTRGAYSLEGEPTNPAHAAVAGLARVIMTEHPQLGVRVLDAPIRDIDVAELRRGLDRVDEEEAALRGTWKALRYVRLPRDDEARQRLRRPMHDDDVAELHCARPGNLDSLLFRPRPARALGEDEVEVCVDAVGLNFKDVMKGMGMLDETALHHTYLGSATDLGMEAAGRVLRVGRRVHDIERGDLVYVMVGGAFASRLQVRREFVVRAARRHTSADACAYMVFQTAWLGLVDKARVRSGERVLIHSAAGGVGLAALQVARHLGGEIYATAGTEQKREYLRSIGIEHVFDSRSLDFVEQIRRRTAGRGVDVVLNSLAGEFLRRSFELLAPGGRFVEIGKQDIAQGRSLPMLPFNAAVSFFAIDLDRMAYERPEDHAPLVKAVVEAFEQGILSPLPTTVVPASRVGEAFRTLAGGAHIGKIVVDFTDGIPEIAPGATPKRLFVASGSYLVTGGLGGFGLRTAEWIMENGGGRVVLAGRRGSLSDEDGRRIAELSVVTGCEVECRSLDVTDEASVRHLIGELAGDTKPLCGVFHSAMVLEDRSVEALDKVALARVMGPKARGAYNLHVATQDLALDHFVLYSSVSALVGNPGQANYAAANSYLDGLVALRRSQGLPATSINWGALSQVGVVSRDPQVAQHLQSIGISTLDPARALVALEACLREDRGNVGIIDIDWGRWMRSTPQTPWRRLAALVDSNAQQCSVAAKTRDQLQKLAQSDRPRAMVAMLVSTIAPTFRTEPENFDARAPLKDYGLDSLIAVELQVAVEEAVGIELSAMEILAGRPVTAIADICLERLFRGPAAAQGEEPALSNGGATETPGDLTCHLLSRIGVQRPYFALRDVEREGEWLRAKIRRSDLQVAEHSVVAVAEAARHLAILGSCACRLRHSMPDGRIYYPVKSAVMESARALAYLRADSDVVVRARCVSADDKQSIARARTELVESDGSLLCAFDVEYHVIAERDFAELFASHAGETPDVNGTDPYEAWAGYPETAFDLRQQTLDLGPLPASKCVGHFPGYPCYPVSIMLRDAIALATRVLQAEHTAMPVNLRIVGGRATTERFVFAGEHVELALTQRSSSSGRELLRCEVRGAGAAAAWFDMEAELVAVEPGSRAGRARPRDQSNRNATRSSSMVSTR